MKRVALAALLVLIAVMTVGVATPAVHAQTAVPTVTATPSTVSEGGTATVSGTGFTPNYFAFAYWQRPDGTTNGVIVPTTSTGTFAFTLGFLAIHGAGTEFVAAYDYGTGRWSAFTSVTVISTTPPPVTMTLSVSPNPVTAGSTATVTGSGFTPNSFVFVGWTRPNGTTNGIWLVTDSTGSFSFTLGFLTQNGCGTEMIYAYDYATARFSAQYPITVTGC